MTRRVILSAPLFLVLTIRGQSPITLSNSNMPGSGDTLRYTNVNPSSVGNYTQTGTNFLWNFHNVLSTTEGVRSFKAALSTPYALFFLALNEYGEKIADTLGAGPVQITKYYNYYKKQSTPVNAFIADGVGMTFSAVPMPCYYSDKDELYKFPMTYPQYDSTTFKFTTPSSSLIPITYSKAGYRITKVDGWGKVITPYDTAACLRLVTTQYAQDTIKTSIGPITVPFGFPNFQRSYQWMTLNSKIPFMEVTGNLVGTQFTITQVRYRGYKRASNPDPVSLGQEWTIEDLKFYPNPVQDQLWLELPQGTNLSYQISDLNGKQVLSGKLTSESSRLAISTASLSAGVYVIRLSTGTHTGLIRFVRE
ncbi:MAG TPA: T9SS type A sorting domain-containing protein [Bacteroidia bacterium]|nr:T9SS type A sorting domain-containing protein [Bacteroidia bacterium]